MWYKGSQYCLKSTVAEHNGFDMDITIANKDNSRPKIIYDNDKVPLVDTYREIRVENFM